ncbi:MAG: ribose-phosphate pyrophosphokinase [Oscillospiraceae bacterium]|jgi:ribose-phosphate pyrophosphokinase|nr:ribose-phosphate pyrophosphokinase [Oscillospiraceae bacterium]
MNFKDTNTKIFACSASRVLAKEIANRLGLPVGRSETKIFSDGEVCVSLDESVRGSDCFIIQSICCPVNNNLMELLIMMDAMKRASAASVTVVAPYFGYARQDCKTKARDPISAKLVADLLTIAGASRILTMDLHAPQIQGFFDIPVDNLLGESLLATVIREFTEDLSEYVVVPPDFGSIKRARCFAKRLGCSIAVIDKNRVEANVSEVMNIIGDVKNKKVILIDDMIDTGGTLCNAAEAVVSRGGAVKVLACATHAVFSGSAIQRINKSCISKLIILDTIPFDKKAALGKEFDIVSTAKVFSEAIKRIKEDRSVSTIFSI